MQHLSRALKPKTARVKAKLTANAPKILHYFYDVTYLHQFMVNSLPILHDAHSSAVFSPLLRREAVQQRLGAKQTVAKESL